MVQFITWISEYDLICPRLQIRARKKMIRRIKKTTLVRSKALNFKVKRCTHNNIDLNFHNFKLIIILNYAATVTM